MADGLTTEGRGSVDDVDMARVVELGHAVDERFRSLNRNPNLGDALDLGGAAARLFVVASDNPAEATKLEAYIRNELGSEDQGALRARVAELASLALGALGLSKRAAVQNSLIDCIKDEVRALEDGERRNYGALPEPEQRPAKKATRTTLPKTRATVKSARAPLSGEVDRKAAGIVEGNADGTKNESTLPIEPTSEDTEAVEAEVEAVIPKNSVYI